MNRNSLFLTTMIIICLLTSSTVKANLRQLDYPLRVGYINKVTSWWGDGILKGLDVPGYSDAKESDYNYLMLGFWSCAGAPLDIALLWHKIGDYGITGLGSTTSEIQAAIRKKYHDNGIKILVSAFGATQFPTTAGMDPVKCGHELGQFVLDNNLDGADADWQDSGALEGGTGEQWLIDFNNALRQKIPDHIVAHAPQGPYFHESKYPSGGYRHIEATIGKDIDFYFIQYYNQEDTQYDSYSELFVKTTAGWFPGTSVKEIADAGVPLQKLVVGKPILQSDAYNTGWVSQADLGAWGKQAYAEFGWYAGFGHWQYSSDASGKAIRDAAGPLLSECVNGGKCVASATASTINKITDSATTVVDNTVTAPSNPTPTPDTTTVTQTPIPVVSPSAGTGLRALNYPLKVAYIDKITTWWGEGVLKDLAVPGYATEDYNYIMLAFWSCAGEPMDIALLWKNLADYGITGFGGNTQQIQMNIMKKYHAHGIKVIVSAFGATQFPTTAGMDATTCGHKLGQFVLDNNLDGADADWEDNGALEAGTGQKWLIDFTKAVREKIPDHIFAHAPQGPYFSATYYKNGGYGAVDSAVGSMIDFYFIQFYNQGDTSYDTYDELFTAATKGAFPGTAVKEIADRGVPLQKLVVGKPIVQSDTTNTGWVSQTDLGAWGVTAYDKFGWNAGFGHWQYSSDTTGQAIRDAAGPLESKCLAAGTCSAASAIISTTTPSVSQTTQTTTDTSTAAASTITAGATTSLTTATSSGTGLRKLDYPLRVGYVNKVTSWWGDGILKGLGVPGYADSRASDYNIIMLAFWFCGGAPMDVALLWQNIGDYGVGGLGANSKEIQAAIRKKFNDNGIKVIISAFGATEFPTTAGYDAATCGKNLAQFVIDNNLDGADADWEDNGALEQGVGEQWLIDFTRAYRAVSPDTILAHAPQGPYFSASYYKNGGYGKVEQTVGADIDFYFIQFYNQGDTSYDTYDELFVKATKGVFAGTAVKEIADRGTPLQKLVVGKPLVKSDATNTGYIAQTDLGAWAAQAYDAFGWHAGVGHWQYSSDPTGKAIRDASGPLLSKCSGGKCA